MNLNRRGITAGAVALLVLSTCPPATAAQADATVVGFSEVIEEVDAILEKERFPDPPKFVSWLARATGDMRRITKNEKWGLPVDVKKLLAMTRVNRQRVRTRGADFTKPHFGAGSIGIRGVARIAQLMRATISAGACDIGHAAESVVRITGDAKIEHVKDCIVIARNVQMASALRSIIIVDGHASISHCTSSIIIARGGAQLASSNADLIAAGRAICVSHVNPTASAAAAENTSAGRDPKPAKKDENGGTSDTVPSEKPHASSNPTWSKSLLASGGVIRTSHAYGGVCIAPRGVHAGHATRLLFLNCGTVCGEQTHCATMTQSAIDAAMPDPASSPTALLEGVARPREDAPVEAARIKVDGTTHELWFRAGANRIQTGPLAEWALTFVDHDVAILTKGKHDMLALSAGWK